MRALIPITEQGTQHQAPDLENLTPNMTHAGPSEAALPFPIFQLSRHVERYMLYDIEVISWLRRVHNILGVLMGTLPQSPQQNVFLGLPLELQPEEARLLVDKRLAFVVNDLGWHQSELASKNAGQLEVMKTNMYEEGVSMARDNWKSRQTRKQNTLKKLRDKADPVEVKESVAEPALETADDSSEDTLFGEPLARGSTLTPTRSLPQSDDYELIPWTKTSTISYPPLTLPTNISLPVIPKVNASSYALFKHLHRLGYFMSPGIRFGCQFAVYPGDPLRFHSHFLSMSYDWDDEIDMLELIGGGRLGTGVKKGWLIGGRDEPEEIDEDNERESKVRTFCLEWAGM